MSPTNLDECMAWPWVPLVERLPEGDYRLSVPGLTDFEVFAETEQQVRAEWTTALRSHLGGYLRVGKVIPLPTTFRVPERSEVQTSGGSHSARVVFLSEGLQVRLSGPITDPQPA